VFTYEDKIETDQGAFIPETEGLEIATEARRYTAYAPRRPQDRDVENEAISLGCRG
jgi:hypothetical protein